MNASGAPELAAKPLPFFQRPEFWQDVQQRARARVFPLLGVASVGALDYKIHDEIGISLLIAAAGAIATLFFNEIRQRLMATFGLARFGPLVQPLMVSIPAAALYFLRARGAEDGEGAAIAALIGLAPVALNLALPYVDPATRAWYQLRDRYLPAQFRPLVMAAASVIVTFGVINGNFGDVKIMVGADPDGTAAATFGKTILTAGLNAVIGFALLRPTPSASPPASETPPPGAAMP
jgi:hypothetical protein